MFRLRMVALWLPARPWRPWGESAAHSGKRGWRVQTVSTELRRLLRDEGYRAHEKKKRRTVMTNVCKRGPWHPRESTFKAASK